MASWARVGLRDWLGPGRAQRARQLARRPRWGNLRRSSPFSASYGFDRGTPVDRHFIDAFVHRYREDVRGDVLEVKDGAYTTRFGGNRVRESHIVDIDKSNPAATIVADLSNRGSLPREAFDCTIVLQTLHLVPDPAGALENLGGALRPAGTLLVSVPTTARIDPDLFEVDFRRWTARGLDRLLRAAYPSWSVEVRGYGNLVACVAALYGIAAEELREADLAPHDPYFLLGACARVRRPPVRPAGQWDVS
jgi:SAM-dependent methyltransferase